MPVQDHRHRLERIAIDRDAPPQRFQIRVGRIAVDPHPVFAQPAGRGQFQPPLQPAVVGQEQQAFRVQIQTPDRHHARHIVGQVVEHRRAALFIAGRGDQPIGLVIQPQARRFRRGNRPAVHRDPVGGSDVQRGRGDDLAVDRDIADLDHPFRLPPRGDPGARQNLGDAFAFMRGGLLGGLFFCGHGGHP